MVRLILLAEMELDLSRVVCGLARVLSLVLIWEGRVPSQSAVAQVRLLVEMELELSVGESGFSVALNKLPRLLPIKYFAVGFSRGAVLV